MSNEVGMYGYPIILPILAYFVLIGIPAAMILRKAGYSRAWVILAFIPLVNLIALWVFALSNWPALRRP